MPNAFAQAKLNGKHGQARVIMKIAGVSVESSNKKAPQTHEGFVALEHGQTGQSMGCQKVHHHGTESSLEPTEI